MQFALWTTTSEQSNKWFCYWKNKLSLLTNKIKPSLRYAVRYNIYHLFC
uniref:Uncharacterized protein n=1 Tax=Arundo donax TaxID=35708 RepID=A0A0A9FIA5_ARUDO